MHEAVRQVEAAVDDKAAPYRGNALVESVAEKLKATYRDKIRSMKGDNGELLAGRKHVYLPLNRNYKPLGVTARDRLDYMSYIIKPSFSSAIRANSRKCGPTLKMIRCGATMIA